MGFQAWILVALNGLSNVRNKYIDNTSDSWDGVYRRNYAEKLNSTAQRARNHLISGMIADVSEEHSRILDVGCGVGTIYRLIRHHVVDYKGIDMSQIAIAQCARTFGTQPGVSFEVAQFENFESAPTFDVIVFNEVLYYFQLRHIRRAVRKAISLLKDEKSLLIISMSDNPKAKLIWFLCRDLLKPIQTIDVKTDRRNRWTVKAFAPLQGSGQRPSNVSPI